MNSRRARRQPLFEQGLLETVENISESEYGLDLLDTDSIAGPNYIPSGIII